MTPAVSVILPTYNRAQLLPRAVDSVLRQTWADFELIVVDDASDDATRQVLERLSDPRLRYLRHESNRGGSAARNTGIAAARGTFVAFQDSDDVWQIDKLGRQMALAVESQPAADVVYCGYTKIANGAEFYVPDRRIVPREGDLLGQLLFSNFVGTPTLLVRRSLLDEVGGFDERLKRFQDWDLVIRLAGVAQFRLVDEPLVVAYDTPGNISSDSAAGTEALRMILESHQDAYRRYPPAMAHILTHLGHLACMSGDSAEARRRFRQTLRIRPYSLTIWAYLLLSLFGGRAYRIARAARSRHVSGLVHIPTS